MRNANRQNKTRIIYDPIVVSTDSAGVFPSIDYQAGLILIDGTKPNVNGVSEALKYFSTEELETVLGNCLEKISAGERDIRSIAGMFAGRGGVRTPESLFVAYESGGMKAV